jgi:hypothetical protein
MFFFIGVGIFFCPILSSKVHFNVVDEEIWKMGLKEACQKLNVNSLIVERVSFNRFDCMGKKYNAKDFCLKMIQEKKIVYKKGKEFLRGYVGGKKEIFCQMGSSAVLTFSCLKKEMKGLCQIKNLCEGLRNIYASSFSLLHSAKEKNGKRSCYYSLK